MTEISFIIPTYNEENFLPKTMDSIRRHLRGRYPYEVIVVDHGSTDRTVELARAAGAVVYVRREAKTISDLRNFGVGHARAPILVFLDADTSLTPEWADNFPDAYAEIQRNPLTITGSKREVPCSAGWVSRFWFKSDKNNAHPTHLGGGHIITTKLLFDKIGGFSSAMETGEDYDFCVRARKSGASLVARSNLRALHYGVPASLRQFVRREVWHGRGDWASLASFLNSKVAILTAIFIVLHLAIVADLFFASIQSSLWISSLGGVLLLCFASALYQYRGQRTSVIMANTVLYYVYYCARALSLVSVSIRRKAKKRTRQVSHQP